jgi:hypothetical protein
MKPIGTAATALIALGVLASPIHAQTPDGDAAGPVTRWRIHALDRPAPPVIRPEPQPVTTPPPPNAVVLFDGRDLSQWSSGGGGQPGWRVRNGAMEIVPGSGALLSRVGFGDVQLHLEWASPAPPAGQGQDRGNSGVFLMGLYEVQILDSYDAETYPDGQAASVYGQYPPRINASRAPGQWQSYDIFFRRPRFGPDGLLVEPARVTVIHNGVLVQNNEEILGPTEWLKHLPYEAHAHALPIKLQDHGSAVRFRNIWALPIPELPAPLPSQVRPTPALTIGEAEMARFVGRYERPGVDAPITIFREGDRLKADFFWRPGALGLIPVAPAEFVLAETDGRVIFELDASGNPTRLIFRLGGSDQVATRSGES